MKCLRNIVPFFVYIFILNFIPTPIESQYLSGDHNLKNLKPTLFDNACEVISRIASL